MAISPDGHCAMLALRRNDNANEPNPGALEGVRPGRIEVVGLQDLYGGSSTGVQSIELVGALQSLPGALYPKDPQPEFVSDSPDGRSAAVTRQGNKAMALIDLSQARRARLMRVPPMGAVQRMGNAEAD